MVGESVGEDAEDDDEDGVGVVEVVTGVSEVLLTAGEEVDSQLPRRPSRQVRGVDDVEVLIVGDGDDEELAGLVVDGVDVGVSVEGDEVVEELPGSVVEGVDDVEVSVVGEEEGVVLVDGGGVVDGVSDDEGVDVAGELVDGGSVLVVSVEGLVVGGEVALDGVEDEEVGSVGRRFRQGKKEIMVYLPGVVEVPLPAKISPSTSLKSGRPSWRWCFFLNARERRA